MVQVINIIIINFIKNIINIKNNTFDCYFCQLLLYYCQFMSIILIITRKKIIQTFSLHNNDNDITDKQLKFLVIII